MCMRLPIACQSGRQRGRLHSLITPSVLAAALLISLLTLNGVAAVHDVSSDMNNKVKRLLADKDSDQGSKVCNNPASFLGVGNTDCLHENIWTAVYLLAVIVAVSIIVERVMTYARTAIKCPQLRKIVNRIFEEMMIMGFLSMVIFTLNTSGAMMSLAFNDLTSYEKLHFYEFFHYIVFLTMIYFIVIVLLLLFIGTVVPKLIWEIKKHPDQRRESMSDIYDPSAYGSQFPSFSSDCAGSNHRMRHSFIRGVSSLSRDINLQSLASTTNDDGTDIMTGDYYLSMHARRRPDEDGVCRAPTMRARALSGMDLVMGSRAYKLLLQRYQLEGWSFRFNVCKQWNLWKSFEILAYNICQNRSGYIYKNPIEMKRLFGVRSTRSQDCQDTQGENAADSSDKDMTYAKYHVLCMRNLLFHMTNIPPSAFLILIVICLLPSIFPNEDHWIFIGVGCLLLLVNVVIFFKVLSILRGIVDDRLRIISMQEIQARFAKKLEASGQMHNRRQQNHSASESAASMNHEGSAVEDFNPAGEDDHNTLQTCPKTAPKKFKAAALAVRAIIRMQMSALCHRQLHYHDNRFWFNSPKFLLRLFQFATIGQAFYLVWLSLVEIPYIVDPQLTDSNRPALLTIMIILPVLSLFVVTPLTMPSLVLVMSLTGIFVDLNTKRKHREKKVTQEELKTHTRIIRRSFLKSLQMPPPLTPPLDPSSAPYMPVQSPSQRDSVASPTSVFLRAYDSPASSFNSRRMDSGPRYVSGNSDSVGHNNPINQSRNKSRSVCSTGNTSWEETVRNSRRTFDLAAFQSWGGAYSSAAPTRSNNMDHQTPPQSASSFTSTTSSIGRSPRSSRMDNGVSASRAGWSQANVEPDLLVSNNAAGDNSEQEGQAQSPVSSSFRTYCSKYGGYPDL